jgi:hypothetical protein
MLKHGGYLIVTVPFLVRVHPSPIDCCRWTETGLSYLLQECGFAEAGIRTGSWGNRACAKGNFSNWRKRGFFGSLANEAHFPVTVWAFAQRGHTADDSSDLRHHDAALVPDGTSACSKSSDCSDGALS